MSKNKIVFIDMDSAVDKFNEKNVDSKINKADLARKVGITYQTMDNYQNGKLPKAFLIVEKICKYTGIKKEDLIKTKNQDGE